MQRFSLSVSLENTYLYDPVWFGCFSREHDVTYDELLKAAL